MNKETFIKELEKKLNILSKEERKDIINEYEDIISEKIKHGKEEIEAVKEFGDINSLANEILESYKIDPNYDKNDFLSNAEEMIKTGAKKLVDVTDDVVDAINKGSENSSLQSVFEIVIKVIILIIGLILLRIPFEIIAALGNNIFYGHFGMMGLNFNILGNLWVIITDIAYFIVCILLIVSLIKKYFTNNDSIDTKEEVVRETKKKSDEKINKNVKKVTPKKEDTNDLKRVHKKTFSSNSASNILISILKIWICLIFIFPLFIMEATSIGIACLNFYLLVKGFGNYALFIFFIATSCFGAEFIKILCRVLFTNKKIRFGNLVFDFILIIISGLFSIDYFLGFTYYNSLDNAYEANMKNFNETITDITYFDNFNNTFIVDESLSDGEVKIDAEYYDQFYSDVNLKKTITTKCFDNVCNDYDTYIIDGIGVNTISYNDFMNSIIIKNIKDKKIYDYSKLSDVNLKIYTNSNTANLIKK